MKVVFCIPMIHGNLVGECHQSLVAVYKYLTMKGIDFDEQQVKNCPYLNVARSNLVALFMADPEATDLFFIDADVGFDPSGAIRILERSEDIVAGVYPLKEDGAGYPVRLKMSDGIPVGRDGLIEAELLPTGFMRIKRNVFEKMAAAYPELKYEDNVVAIRGSDVKEGYDFFNMGIDRGKKRFTTEDYAFCQRWTDIGGQCWVLPDIDFTHVGMKAYAGNLHMAYLEHSGGSLTRALAIKGWLHAREAEWLARQAMKRKVVIEIGSAWGRSTRVMADHMNGGRIYALDDWKGPREISMTPEESEAMYPTFLDNLSDHIASGRVVPINCDHAHVPELPHPDMVFIDGDHFPESVLRDVDTWKNRLVSGGLLCGHDYDRDSVRLPVLHLLPEAKAVPNTTLWYWEKP